MRPPLTLEEIAADLARRLLPKAVYRGLKRTTWMKRVNKKRADRRRAEAFGDCSRMARLLPCCWCGALPPAVDPAHVRSRGAGGKDWANVVPLCGGPGGCHGRQHTVGVRAFERATGLDLAAIAEQVAVDVTHHDCDDWPDRSGLACAVCLTPIEEPRRP